MRTEIVARHDGLQKRMAIQKELKITHAKPVIILSLNLPALFVDKPITHSVISVAIKEVQQKLTKLGSAVIERRVCRLSNGVETFWVVDAQSAQRLKKAMIEIEQDSSLGTIYNLEVIDKQGQVISRRSSEMNKRDCPVCGRTLWFNLGNHRHTEAEYDELLERLVSQTENISIYDYDLVI